MAALVVRRQRRLLLPLLLLIRAVGGAAPPAARRATADARASGAELRARGFALVRGEVESPLVDAVGAHARGTLDELLARVAAKGGDVLEQRYSFAEVCHRQRLRWDVRLPDTPSWRRLRARALQLAAPAIAEAAGGGGAAGPCRVREAMSGVVISRPGARAQSFHADGNVGGLFSVFVPLLPVRADGDGTQFWPGSHEDAHAAALAPTLQWDEAAMACMEAPAVPAGGVLVFDYRTVHRGLPSAGRDRPVAYLVAAVQRPGAGRRGPVDDFNFPPLRLADASARQVRGMPRWEPADADDD